MVTLQIHLSTPCELCNMLEVLEDLPSSEYSEDLDMRISSHYDHIRVYFFTKDGEFLGEGYSIPT